MPYYDLAEIIYQWHDSTSLLCSPSTAQRKKKKKCWSLLCYRISLLVTLAEKHATGLYYVH